MGAGINLMHGANHCPLDDANLSTGGTCTGIRAYPQLAVTAHSYLQGGQYRHAGIVQIADELF